MMEEGIKLFHGNPNSMTVAQLKKELDDRGLDTKGKKDDLKERLCEALFGKKKDDKDDGLGDSSSDDEKEEKDQGPYWNEWYHKKEEVCARMGMPKDNGYVTVRMLDDRSDSEDDSPPTEDEVNKIRIILYTDARNKAYERAYKFSQGQNPQMDRMRQMMRENAADSDDDMMDSDDDDDGFFMFNTTNGNTVVMGMEAQIKKATGAKKPKSEQFDELSMFTFALHFNNMWFNDNELWEDGELMQKSCKKLAAAWKKLLANTDEELGIDPEFTRPGIEALLENFDKMLNKEFHFGSRPKYPFKWKP